MFERIVVSMVLVGAGIAAYQLVLFIQQRWATVGSKREARTDRSALLVFTSPTCAPCKLQQMPIVNRLMDEWGDRISLRVIDVTEQPDMATRFGVWSLPTTIVLDGSGHVEAINQGIAGAVKLREQFERACQPAVNAPTNRPANQPAN